MKIILVLILLLIPSFGYAHSEGVAGNKFKALEEKKDEYRVLHKVAQVLESPVTCPIKLYHFLRP
jgi:hypothetical protein